MCGYGVGWKESAGWNTGPMKIGLYLKWWTKKITSRNNPKPTEKLAGPHNERRLHYKNYNRGKNGREKEKTKTKNDVTGLDAERRLQHVEGES